MGCPAAAYCCVWRSWALVASIAAATKEGAVGWLASRSSRDSSGLWRVLAAVAVIGGGRAAGEMIVTTAIASARFAATVIAIAA